MDIDRLTCNSTVINYNNINYFLILLNLLKSIHILKAKKNILGFT